MKNALCEQYDKWKYKLYWKRQLKPLFFYGVQMDTCWQFPAFLFNISRTGKNSLTETLQGSEVSFPHIRVIPSMLPQVSCLKTILLFNINQTAQHGVLREHIKICALTESFPWAFNPTKSQACNNAVVWLRPCQGFQS